MLRLILGLMFFLRNVALSLLVVVHTKPIPQSGILMRSDERLHRAICFCKRQGNLLYGRRSE